jgi:hypothetical protein
MSGAAVGSSDLLGHIVLNSLEAVLFVFARPSIATIKKNKPICNRPTAAQLHANERCLREMQSPQIGQAMVKSIQSPKKRRKRSSWSRKKCVSTQNTIGNDMNNTVIVLMTRDVA